MFHLHSDKAKISKNIRRMEKTLATLADFCSCFLPEPDPAMGGLRLPVDACLSVEVHC
jgi:hypothetical protein